MAAKGLDPRPDDVVISVRGMLETHRRHHTVERAKRHYCQLLPAYTIFEQATGGCLDSLAAAFAGFRHLGGSEADTPLGQAKARMFEDLTSAKCLGER